MKNLLKISILTAMGGTLFASQATFAATTNAPGKFRPPTETQQLAGAVNFATAKSALPIVTDLPVTAFDNNIQSNVPAKVFSEAGHKPVVKANFKAQQLFNPALFPQTSKQLATVAPQAFGGGGIQFTGSRITPEATGTSYPLSATGKLWFTLNGIWYMCSGSMVKPGVVVTAGHCVHSGNGAASGWAANFQFAPAYRNGKAPYNVWTNWQWVNTTSTWYWGGGNVPNAADYGVIVFDKNASGYRIGDYTGWLGWQYPAMVGQHVTALGYPGNIDAGNINQRMDSNVDQGPNNTGVFGSYMEGGSSGGGIVFNLGENGNGAPTGSWEFNRNRLVSVISYGYTSPANYMVQGGSQFDDRFENLLDAACSKVPSAC